MFLAVLRFLAYLFKHEQKVEFLEFVFTVNGLKG